MQLVTQCLLAYATSPEGVGGYYCHHQWPIIPLTLHQLPANNTMPLSRSLYPWLKCSTAVKCFPNRCTAGTDQDRGKGSDNLKAEITNGGVAAQFPVTAAALHCTGTKERVFFVVDTWHPFQLRDMATAYKSQTSRTALLFIMICLCNVLLAIVYETRTSA